MDDEADWEEHRGGESAGNRTQGDRQRKTNHQACRFPFRRQPVKEGGKGIQAQHRAGSGERVGRRPLTVATITEIVSFCHDLCTHARSSADIPAW